MILSRSHYCPYRIEAHANLAYVEYENGHWCYSCNRGELKEKNYYAYKIHNGRDDNHQLDESIVLPEGVTNNPKEFSLEVIKWLNKYYIFEEQIRKYGIMFVPYTDFTTKTGVRHYGDSLIFPINIDGITVAYQRRYFGEKLFFSKNTQRHIFNIDDFSSSNTVVLTEDYLSAIRVGEVANSICLFGTKGTQNILKYVVRTYKNVLIWLDPDQPGIEASEQLIIQLTRLMGNMLTIMAFSSSEPITLKVIRSKYDPKVYSKTEIQEILND